MRNPVRGILTLKKNEKRPAKNNKKNKPSGPGEPLIPPPELPIANRPDPPLNGPFVPIKTTKTDKGAACVSSPLFSRRLWRKKMAPSGKTRPSLGLCERLENGHIELKAHEPAFIERRESLSRPDGQDGVAAIDHFIEHVLAIQRQPHAVFMGD